MSNALKLANANKNPEVRQDDPSPHYGGHKIVREINIPFSRLLDFVDLNTMRATAKFKHCKHGLQTNCSFLFGHVNFNTINCGLEGLQGKSCLYTESVASGGKKA